MKAHLNLTFILVTFGGAAALTGCGANDVVSQRAGADRQSADQRSPTANGQAGGGQAVSVATIEVPVAGDDADPTKGDVVVGLDNKVSCYQKSSNVCLFIQTNRTSLASMKGLCANGDASADLQKGNTCADLDITAKCNIEIKGDRFTIYNIGGLTKDKDDTLKEQCAGVKADGKVFKGTYVTLTDSYVANLAGNGKKNNNILEILKKVFQGIFGFLLQFFQQR